ncbi:hypothetical protein CLIB1444_01S12090 [[Candida] jaroonii]|uniref:Uncharacterized protein n=1 Tax=[Candida] jaroonii TaxID=467808 RepID=A0ACA9Y161_9ASCO|nr:hypothetical protein CLIB1444_01S12090 [[Candida] jaroonii]
MKLTDLPTEVINEIFSYIDIETCEKIRSFNIPQISSFLDNNIYGKSIILLNNKTPGDNKATKMLFKFIDFHDLGKITNVAKIVPEAVSDDIHDINDINFNNDNDNNKISNDNNNSNNPIIPKRFVLSYSYYRSRYNDNDHDPFLTNFTSTLPLIGEHYLSKIGNTEISIDLFNKKISSLETDCVIKLLESDVFDHNLGYLNLNRFRRLPEANINSLTNCLNENLQKFHNLHTLTLSSNAITSIEKFNLPDSILFLNLDNNRLRSIPSDFKFPKDLIKLNISCNYINDLSNIEFPESLQYLDIQLNELKNLDIKFPSDLKVLIACGNNISLDEETKFPKNLTYLNLLQNPLNNLKSLDKNESLKTIFLDAALENKCENHAVTFI